MKQYVVSIDTGKRLVKKILPLKNEPTGTIDLSKETGIPLMYLDYEVQDGVCYIKTNNYIRISENHMVLSLRKLEDNLSLNGKNFFSGDRFTISVRAFNRSYCDFKKYDVARYQQLRIGTNANCDIRLHDSFVSGEHLVLKKQGSIWVAESRGRNGTYCNHERIDKPIQVQPGDCIEITGYKIYLLGNTIALNRSDAFHTVLPELVINNAVNHQTYTDTSRFSKSPRMVEPLDTEEIHIEQPPQKNKQRKTPFLFVLGPSLTMPIPILCMVLFNVFVNSEGSGSWLSYMGMVISVILFALIGVYWSVARNKYDVKSEKEEEHQRRSAYKKYIKDSENHIVSKQNKNRALLEKQYVPAKVLMERIRTDAALLWNRNVNHPDFLHVRMGTGSMNNPNPIQIPPERFSVDQDNLRTLPFSLYEKYKMLSPVPKLLDLNHNKIIGVVGEPADIQGIADNMIMQIVMLHSYTDVKLAVLMQEEFEPLELHWMRWLPHVFNEDRSLRYMADDARSREEVLYALTGELRKRKIILEENQCKKPAFKKIILFCTASVLIENEMIYRYMTDDVDYGITFVLLYGRMEDLPNECKLILQSNRDNHSIYRLDEAASEEQQLLFETVGRTRSQKLARKLTGLHITEINESAIPDRLDYFDMLKIGKIEQWDLLKHYRENRSYEGIKAIIGVGTGERTIALDIHEKKHGPHGLIAGTTGSGKSELIQTFLISLAMNYHPNEVAFILIDYKGGGMANTLIGLPHVAGTITNIGTGGEDGESIDENQSRRALISIRSEIKRRQRIFNRYRVSHIDMYMRLYREHKAEDPLPHLIIISDEFAELKKEQPEFIKELVSTARVGRSLGIHLILATQKPAGVVDDEIWANARFKLCLRVQDKQDSIGMLKRPEASELTRTGRAYMQIGNDELFEQFQSAYSGAGYQPKESALDWDEDAISMIDLNGRTTLVHAPDSKNDQQPSTQLETAVNYIRKISEENGIFSTRPLWLPVLPERIQYTDLPEVENYMEPGTVSVPVGLIDDPEQQRQYPFVINYSTANHVLIAGQSGCGKTVLLQSIAAGLIRRYTPDQCQFYFMDFASSSFGVFKTLPHCGGVVLSEEAERFQRLIKLLNKKIELRKTLFSEKNVGTYSEYCKTGAKLPMILVFLDGWFECVELYLEQEEALSHLFRECGRYGIQFTVTMTHMGDMRYRIKQNFGMIIPLQFVEKTDYIEVFGKTPEIFPTRTPGRGLILTDKTMEFQSILPAAGQSEQDRRNTMTAAFTNYAKHYAGAWAEPIPMVPYGQTYEAFYLEHRECFAHNRLPLGYTIDDIDLYSFDLEKGYCYNISGVEDDSIVLAFNHIMAAGRHQNWQLHLVRLNSQMTGFNTDQVKVYRSYDDVRQLLIHLREEFKARSDGWKAYQKDHPKEEKPFGFCHQHFDIQWVLIDDLGAFEKVIYETAGKEAMNDITELFIKEGRGRGIYFAAGYPAVMEQGAYYMQTAKLMQQQGDAVHYGGHLDQQILVSPGVIPVRKQTEEKSANLGDAMIHGKLKDIWQPDR